MDYSNEFLTKIEQGGVINSSAEMLADVLDLDEAQRNDFFKDFNNKDSAVARAYQKGANKYAFKVQQEVAKKAMEGDLKAIEKMEEFKRLNRFNKR